MPLEDPFSTLYVVWIQTVSILWYNFVFIKGGVTKYDIWPPSVGNSWRTADDSQDNWPAIMSNIDQVRPYYRFYI
jgi:hypothetical protein